jgi:S-adenosylmethionine:tRNA ribosyltransferase-isomerase
VIAHATDCFSAHELRDVSPVERDDVALLVSRAGDETLTNACFDELPRFLEAGDLLVVNTSATLPAALRGQIDGEDVEMHLSTPVGAPGVDPAGDEPWVVELRTVDRRPMPAPRTGTRVLLAGGAVAEVVAPYLGSSRLAIALLSLDDDGAARALAEGPLARYAGGPVERYLARHGHPIRYRHSPDGLGIDAYQTVFSRRPGSAEMPSAARPFSPELVTELVSRGVMFAPITLHCGVSSLEAGESPYPERYEVPAETARLVNAARWWGGRVIAVGTTVVRALETVADADGVVSGGAGITSVVVTPEHGVRAIDGLLTGWHEPESSHLRLLEAVAGPELLERSYEAAHAAGYRFHEFGDSNLILR